MNLKTCAHLDALALRILAAAKDAGFSPALYDWGEVTEHIDLFCWTYGFENARSLGRPSRYDTDHCEFSRRWFAAYAQARNEWHAQARDARSV